jgi:hypothetical protein
MVFTGKFKHKYKLVYKNIETNKQKTIYFDKHKEDLQNQLDMLRYYRKIEDEIYNTKATKIIEQKMNIIKLDILTKKDI